MAVHKPELKKPQQSEKGRSFMVPLLIAAGVIAVIGIIVLATDKVHSNDPTLTAAPPTGIPGQIYHASPEKMAKEQQIRAKMDAELGAIRGASVAVPNKVTSGQAGTVGQPGIASQGANPGVPSPSTYVGTTPTPAATH